MSSDDVAISIKNLSKCYQIYGQPRDRLKQFVLPRFQRLAGRAPKSYFNEFWALRDVSFDITPYPCDSATMRARWSPVPFCSICSIASAAHSRGTKPLPAEVETASFSG